MNDSIPMLVVAGQPNEGKTSVISTLAEDDRAVVDPYPGTTKAHRKYKICLDGETKLLLYDTPGFENPGEVLEWMRENEKHHENPAQAFLDDPENRKYKLDREIFEPIAKGAVVLHVVDPSRKPFEEDKWQAEILQHCGVPRIGLFNPRKEEGSKYKKEWIALMNKHMNVWREFDACQAVFADRVELIEMLGIANPDWKPGVREMVKALAKEWEHRMEKSAEEIVHGIRSAVQFQVVERLNTEKADQSAEDARRRATEKVKKKIIGIETDFRKKTRDRFNHNADHWKETDSALELDIFSEQAGEIFGFSKRTVVIACALASAGVGVLIDVATGGATLGLGTLIGTIVGGGGAYFYFDKAVDIEMPGIPIGPFRLPKWKIGDATLKACMERRSKLPGILIERMYCYSLAAASWAHGQRPVKPGSADVGGLERITAILEEKESDGKSGAMKFQALVELWHRSREQGVQDSKVIGAVEEAETWLIKKLTSELINATARSKRQ
jgi:hypothetical protein